MDRPHGITCSLRWLSLNKFYVVKESPQRKHVRKALQAFRAHAHIGTQGKGLRAKGGFASERGSLEKKQVIVQQ